VSTGLGAGDGPSLPRVFAAGHGTIEVRSARSEDFGGVERLLGMLQGQDADPVARRPFDRALVDRRRLVLVAQETGATGAIVGTLDLFLVDNSTHGGAPWAGVENVVVAPEARRRGIGAALVTSAVEIARGAGAYKVQLLSRSDRSDAHALYERTGFDAPVRGFRRYL
jgi:GNAT superfamily N-acetyltransferase